MLLQSPAPGFLLLLAGVLLPVSVVYSGFPGGFPASVMKLERAFPADQRVEMEVLRARDRARHQRILMGSGGATSVGGIVDFSVEGTSDPYLVGLYFTRVKLGTPPREYNVQIDTGSDILWVTCNSCSDCPRTSGLGVDLNFYDSTISTTADLVSCSDPICSPDVQTTSSQCATETNQCAYSFQYGDGSGTSGFYVSDMFYFDMILGNSMIANSSASIVFGCSTYQSGDLTKSDRAIDGIFGFGQQGMSVVSQLSSRGITPRAFSHCLKGEGNGGGILVLGEILEPNIVYTPLVPSQPHYNLNLQSIAINGHLLPIDQAVFSTSNNRGTIVDSGTTLAYLVEEAYDPFVSGMVLLDFIEKDDGGKDERESGRTKTWPYAAVVCFCWWCRQASQLFIINSAVSQTVKPIIVKGSQCYLVSSSVSDIFPLVSMNFDGGATMVLRPEEYLVHMGFVDGAALWCMGFQKVRDQGVTILGDLVLKDKIFVYDLARQRIGWANYDCSLSVNVSLTSGKDEFVNAGQLSVSSSPKSSVFEAFVAQILLLSIGFFIFN